MPGQARLLPTAAAHGCCSRLSPCCLNSHKRGAQVAARLGLPMHGVNVPGHFFLTPADPSLEFLVDAFEGGRGRSGAQWGRSAVERSAGMAWGDRARLVPSCPPARRCSAPSAVRACSPPPSCLLPSSPGGEISFLQDAEATLERIYGRPVQVRRRMDAHRECSGGCAMATPAARSCSPPRWGQA